ncbi:MAG TPA: non-homologous end-joining DNA ligase [Luteitalea sp.]|nr:non-homologous end-joining DNA ligase [Luteitalea sp.]
MAKPVVRGVAISSATRVMFPDQGITKLDLAAYMDAVAEWMLPHVVDRPLSLLFCPDGIAGECVYLKHGKAGSPASLRRITIREKTKADVYMVADTPEALVALMQMNWVEVHTWNSCAASIEQPDRIIIDLDPGPDVRWPQVVAAARDTRTVLESLGLQAWVKTTGGRGLHVVVPLLDGVSWRAGFDAGGQVAEALVGENPKLYTTAFAKDGREAQILVDVLRNRRGSTSVSAYSPRARAGATVSTPIAWDELSARKPPDRFTVRTIPSRLKKLGADPWHGYWTCRQGLQSHKS